MTRTIKFLEILCCPICQGELSLQTLKGRTENPGADGEVGEGVLRCNCGMCFPIIDGVPRLIEKGMAAYPEFESAHHDALARADSEMPSNVTDGRDAYEKIRAQYSRTWAIFDYTNDKTWGWTIEDRKRVFLGDVQLSESDLRGKRLLDAGCGNGTLSAAISSFGVDVVGMDLNNGLGAANEHKGRFAGGFDANIHYVQGNLFRPPIKQESFDFIYCSGAVHRTPDPKATFGKLVPMLKTNGRLHVWVSRRRNLVVRSVKRTAHKLTRPLSLEGRLRFCRIVAPGYMVATTVANALGVATFRNRSLREITLDLTDSFAPEYVSGHSEEEVCGWFREAGFKNIVVTGKQKHGFGVNGDRV